MQRTERRDRPPRIGLTAYRERAGWGVWDEAADLLPATYSEAIEQSGGLPLLLPAPRNDATGRVEATLAAIDGLVLSGGPDVDPARYGAARDANTGSPRTDRDEWELALARGAVRIGLPVLGICRGLQTLNVALGGTLVQHLPDVVGDDRHCPTVGRHGRHAIRTADGSRVAALHGQRAEVAVYHHQAVDVLAPGLIATAWAEDGTVEAAELPGPAWVVGVQWHPEVHDGGDLFDEFVAVCSRRQPATAGSAGR